MLEKRIPLPKHISWMFAGTNSRKWFVATRVILAAVMGTSKVWSGWLNTYKIHNHEWLLQSVYERKGGRGLVTVSNHDSCIDDPLLWGALKWRSVFNYNGLRWILAADDICFTKYWHALFFSLGKVVPVTRGEGVYQRSMDFILDKVDNGGWTHIFPEGKVNLDKSLIRFKWGVGRFVAEAKKYPIVLPMYHIGMDDILPNRRPYIPRIKKAFQSSYYENEIKRMMMTKKPSLLKKITIYVGQPMEFSGDIELLRSKKKTPAEIRKYITDKIQEEMHRLKEKAEHLHTETFPAKV